MLRAIRETERLASGDVREQLMAIAAEIVPSDIIAFQAIDPQTHHTAQIASPNGWVTADYEQIFRGHLPEHPLLRHFLRTGDGDAVRMSDVVSRRELRGLGIYQDFYRPLGIHHQMACLLTSDLGVVNTLVLSRGTIDFSQAERQLLLLARPYLANLLAASETRSWFDAALAALDAIDDTSYGVILLGQLGKIGVMNRSARLLLDTYFRRCGGEGGTLPEELASWLGEQRRAPSLDHPVPPRPFTLSRGSRHLTVTLSEHHSSTALLLSETDAAAPAATTESGLTSRERDVLWLVAHGHTSAQAAQVLRISPRTVEKHLEHIYAKLGAASRTEAALRVFGTAGGRPPAGMHT
ncbi:helix-turn-helix transcriptional regulator [Nonomuraea sp. NPDC049709]|uniref:helix-turn-helix transcriptional regulator n=1 Tax=Nonomuraea sp. NPDC049709 TaxID=3154736 RepID=UPI00342F0E86